VNGASLYERPEYRRLLALARKSLERTGGDITAAVGVSTPDDGERKAIIGITGQYRPAAAGKITVRLADLDTAIRAFTGRGLTDLLTDMGGPLRNRPAETSARMQAVESLVQSAEDSPLHSACGWYQEWLRGLARDGTLTKLVNQGDKPRLTYAVRVLEDLIQRPAGTAPVMLAELAVALTGDTKALSHGTVLSTLVLRALALRAGADRPQSAEQRRVLWESCDVVLDDLASRVLVLNLRAEGEGLGEWMTGASQYGTPLYVTLQQLSAHPVTLAKTLVRICENPAVLRRAAGELGPASAPLLCTEGRPSTAFHRLAHRIADGGGELLYHGDFDWPGIAIATAVMQRHRAQPWRMRAADYETAVQTDTDHVKLTGEPQPTPWDPALGMAMTAAGLVVYEEGVAATLIADLVA